MVMRGYTEILKEERERIVKRIIWVASVSFTRTLEGGSPNIGSGLWESSNSQK